MICLAHEITDKVQILRRTLRRFYDPAAPPAASARESPLSVDRSVKICGALPGRSVVLTVGHRFITFDPRHVCYPYCSSRVKRTREIRPMGVSVLIKYATEHISITLRVTNVGYLRFFAPTTRHIANMEHVWHLRPPPTSTHCPVNGQTTKKPVSIKSRWGAMPTRSVSTSI